MRKIILSTFVFLALSQSAFAALPPFYQSTAELNSLLRDPRLAEKMGSGEPILNIQRNDQGYLITGNRYQIQANVNYHAPEKKGFVGPAIFTIDFNDLQPLSK